MRRPFRKTFIITGVGGGRDAVEVLPSDVSGVVRGVVVRSDLIAPTGVLFLTEALTTVEPADEAVIYESAAVAYTTSTTAADVRDDFSDTPAPFVNGLFAQFNETGAAGAYGLTVTVYGEVD